MEHLRQKFTVFLQMQQQQTADMPPIIVVPISPTKEK
jgi:hypothetical protein